MQPETDQLTSTVLRDKCPDTYRATTVGATGKKSRPQTSGGLFSLVPNGSRCHFLTRKTTLLLSVPLGVVTLT